MKVIHHNDKLGFGKYKDYTLSQVCQIDSSYVDWLINSVMEYVFELYDINYWTDVFEGHHNILPKDGLYLLAFRDDNHIDYKLEYYTAGTNIQNHYPLDGKEYDWYHCLAYHYIPEFSKLNEKWKYQIKGDRLYSIWALRTITNQIGYLWGGYGNGLFDYKKEEIESNFYGEEDGFKMDEDGIIRLYDEGYIATGDCEIFLGEFYFGRYSENYLGNHNSLYQYCFDSNKGIL